MNRSLPNLTLRLLIFLAAGAALGEERDSKARGDESAQSKVELRMSLSRPLVRPLDVGERIALPLTVAFRNAPPKSRIYVHVLALDNDAWIAPGGATLRATAPSFSMSGNFAEGDQSMFKIGPSNFPVSVLLKNDDLEKMFAKLIGPGKNDGKEFVEGISGNKEGYRLFLAFLTSVGSRAEGVEHGTVDFLVPDYPHYYNALLIVPMLFVFNSDGTARVHYSGATSTTVTVPIRPNRPEPNREDKNKKASPEIPGKATIVGFLPANAVLATGVSNTLELRVRYQDLARGTAIYVAPIPASGDRYVLGPLSVTAGGVRVSGKPTFIDRQSDLFRIPKESRPLKISYIGEQELEAAHIGTVEAGGSGEIIGKVTFVPPAFARRYERMHLVPILLVPTQDGLRYLLDSERLQGPRLLVSEG